MSEHDRSSAPGDTPAPQPMAHDTSQAQDEQKQAKDPATNPSPPGSPPLDQEALEQGRDTLERVKPY